MVQGLQPGPGGHGLPEAASEVTEGLASAPSGGLRGVHTAGFAPSCDRGVVWHLTSMWLCIRTAISALEKP